MNKIVIADQEFLVVSKPINTFLKLYGANYNLLRLILLRMEMYTFQTISLQQLNILFEFLREIIPLRIGFKPLYTYHIIYLEYTNSYRTYRHLFNLPVNGQRT